MIKTKALVGHGNWEKWLLDNCGDVSVHTARRWMQLAKHAHARDLDDCRTMRQAYIACGILPEPQQKTRAIGTAEVDLFACFVSEVSRLADKLEGLDLSTLPPARKEEIRGKLKDIEGRL